MARQYTITMMPQGQGWKPEITAADAITPPGPNEMIIAYGDSVAPHRALEIQNGWKWLYHGIRERGLLNAQFVGNLLLTGAPINSLTTPNRKTSGVTGDFAADEIFVGMGTGIATGKIGSGATQMLDSGMRMLREYARENPA